MKKVLERKIRKKKRELVRRQLKKEKIEGANSK
jgi:hypothetical protein